MYSPLSTVRFFVLIFLCVIQKITYSQTDKDLVHEYEVDSVEIDASSSRVDWVLLKGTVSYVGNSSKYIAVIQSNSIIAPLADSSYQGLRIMEFGDFRLLNGQPHPDSVLHEINADLKYVEFHGKQSFNYIIKAFCTTGGYPPPKDSSNYVGTVFRGRSQNGGMLFDTNKSLHDSNEEYLKSGTCPGYTESKSGFMDKPSAWKKLVSHAFCSKYDVPEIVIANYDELKKAKTKKGFDIKVHFNEKGNLKNDYEKKPFAIIKILDIDCGGNFTDGKKIDSKNDGFYYLGVHYCMEYVGNHRRVREVLEGRYKPSEGDTMLTYCKDLE